MKEMWNNKYAVNEYIYGEYPNKYFKYAIDTFLPSGKILLPAEGEGRNAVYAAQKGLEAVAFDQSVEGKNKAEKLAEKVGVKIDYQVGEFPELPLINEKFDVAALIYAHFAPQLRSRYHRLIGNLINPGGFIIVEGFSKQHIEYQNANPNIGGPRNIEMLYTKEMIQNDFFNFEAIELIETEVDLAEGSGHNGIGKVIRFIGKKKT
ncbi:MAG: class I SAM-dependent methyltransferase [Bacteroidia bacterium]|nr:class I SAM-dependent methyltransferase [Bacteroidia bacterium]